MSSFEKDNSFREHWILVLYNFPYFMKLGESLAVTNLMDSQKRLHEILVLNLQHMQPNNKNKMVKSVRICL